MSPIYRIADLTVDLQFRGITLQKQAPAYLCGTTGPVDISIALTEDFLRQKQRENPHLSLDECEYIWTGAEFYRRLPGYDGFVLHASAVAYQGRAYLFSAPCGTGKSTHVGQWQSYFGAHRAVIINDDKPALRFNNGRFYVYGTPWSGKSPYSANIKVPLQAICFLEQATHNWLHKITAKEAIGLVLGQTLRPQQLYNLNQLLDLLDCLLGQIPVYKMGCDISHRAADLAYRVMSANVD